MELDRIESLLEKYFEATTTMAEEERLRAYFMRDDIPAHLRQYAPLFQYMVQGKEEQFTKAVPLRPKKRYWGWASVAATVVLMLGLYVNKNQQEQKEALYAYQQTKKALGLLSANLERGTEKMIYLNEFETAKEKIYNQN